MRFVIGLAVIGVVVALASPWIRQAVTVARLLEDGRGLLPGVQTAVDSHAPPPTDDGDLSAPSSLLLRPRHLR